MTTPVITINGQQLSPELAVTVVTALRSLEAELGSPEFIANCQVLRDHCVDIFAIMARKTK